MTADVVDLAMWGPSSSGKTMLLAQLYSRWRVEDSGWEVRTSEIGQGFVEEMREWVEARNLFPPPTDPGNVQEVVYEFQHRTSAWRARLSIEDRAGAHYEQLPDEVLDRLQRARGLILLFDPARHASDIGREVLLTLERLHIRSGRSGKDERPIAICLTKADGLIRTPDSLKLARGQPDQFVRQWITRELAPDILSKIASYSAKHRFFPISSVGVVERCGAIEPVLFCDEYLIERIIPRVAPLNLEAPFLWMFHELGGPR